LARAARALRWRRAPRRRVLETGAIRGAIPFARRNFRKRWLNRTRRSNVPKTPNSSLR
jgi:hypothetical protein